MFVVCDVETEGLDNPQKLWVVVVKEVESGRVHVFRNLHDHSRTGPDSLAAFTRLASRVSVWIGHNFIAFDAPVLRRVCSVDIPLDRIIDTLVCSRLLNFGILGGHSLAAWGQRLDCPKSDFSDFSGWSQAMEDYCIQDIEVTHKLYQKFLPYINDQGWKVSLRVEHDIAGVSLDISKNGFYFDVPKAKELYSSIYSKVQKLLLELQETFPPRSVLLREITPKVTKHGTLNRQDFRWVPDGDLSAFSADAPFSHIEFRVFNPGSTKQVVERLNEAGWEPFEKTKGHIEAERERDQERLRHFRVYGWKISEANLATLPETAPESARKLAEWLILDSRRSTLNEWLEAVHDDDSRIHGTFNHIGAWTHRMSHAGPNMANIPAEPSVYAHDMRSLWSVPKGRLLVGVDAESIQLRVLAHYMNDARFIKAVHEGKKEDGTDPHSLNVTALGSICKSRSFAKTFIYAWLLGAGIAKVAQILECSLEEAREACDRFLGFYPGLRTLKTVQIPEDAERGYFVGLDKRLVKCDNNHLMLAGYLQNGESVIMKHANILWRNKLIKENVPFKQVNFVHDEWQTETVDDLDTAKYIAEVQADSIREVGVSLGLKCPLAGSILNSHGNLAISTNWSLTH